MQRILKIFYIVSIIMLSLSLTGCNESEETEFQEISAEELDEKGASDETDMVKDEEKTEKIFVHVCGEVNNPGVYELNAGSRVFEALDAAGGVTKDAADDSVNQAEVLSDGQQLEILSEEQMSRNELTETFYSGKMNINKATKEELMTLSGIGESKADAIIRYREENGNFNSIEEIMEIEGIKEGVFRKIEEQITTS